MSVQLVSLINVPQTIDSVVLGPYATQVRSGSTITVEVAAAVLARRCQANVLQESGEVRWANAEGTAIVGPDGAAVALGGGGSFAELSDAPDISAAPKRLLSVNDVGDGLGLVNQVGPVIQSSGATPGVPIPAANVVGGMVVVWDCGYVGGSPLTVQLPTAEAMLAEAPWVLDSPKFGVTGVGVLWIARNSNATQTMTITGNTGCDMVGTAVVPAGKARGYVIAAIEDEPTFFEVYDAFEADI